jgi:hypothetical protein
MQPIVVHRRLRQGGALGTQSAEVGRVIRVAAHAVDALALDQQTATDTAVTTGGFDLLAHEFLLLRHISNSPNVS